MKETSNKNKGFIKTLRIKKQKEYTEKIKKTKNIGRNKRREIVK